MKKSILLLIIAILSQINGLQAMLPYRTAAYKYGIKPSAMNVGRGYQPSSFTNVSFVRPSFNFSGRGFATGEKLIQARQNLFKAISEGDSFKLVQSLHKAYETVGYTSEILQLTEPFVVDLRKKINTNLESLIIDRQNLDQLKKDLQINPPATKFERIQAAETISKQRRSLSQKANDISVLEDLKKTIENYEDDMVNKNLKLLDPFKDISETTWPVTMPVEMQSSIGEPRIVSEAVMEPAGVWESTLD